MRIFGAILTLDHWQNCGKTCGVKLQWIAERHDAAGEVLAARTKKTNAAIFRQKTRFGHTKTWYLRKMINGERELFLLGESPSIAIDIADRINAFLMDPTTTLADAVAKFNPRALERKTRYSNLIEAYEVHSANIALLGLKENTAYRYWRALVNIIRKVDAWRKGDDFVSVTGTGGRGEQAFTDCLNRSIGELDASLIMDYKRLMLEGVEDAEAELVAKITTDGTITSARSVFGRAAMKVYQEKRLSLPDLRPFMEVELFRAKKYFELPPAAVVSRVFTDLPSLRAQDIATYRIVFAALHCGMRRSEILALRTSWIEDGPPATIKLREKGEFKPKHGHGRTITILPWVAAELREIAACGDRYIDEGDAGDAAKANRAALWLKSKGVDAAKPLHECRKLWISWKAKTEGLLVAQKQAGHSDPKTTTDHYADDKLSSNLVHFWAEKHKTA